MQGYLDPFARCYSGPLVFHHEASYGHGLSYRHAAADHRLKGPRPTAQV